MLKRTHTTAGTCFVTTVILSFLAIVASIAAAKADIIEYSDNVYSNVMELFNVNSTVIPAYLINADIKRIIGKTTEEGLNSVSLYSMSLPDEEDQGENHPVCESFIGIDLDNGKSVYCHMNQIVVIAANIRRYTYLLILRLFFRPEKDEILALDIPIFKTPLRYASDNKKEEFKAWAHRKRLGTLSPFNGNDFEFIAEGEDIAANFKWLKELLRLGIYESRTPVIYQLEEEQQQIEAKSFVSRPIVLSDILTKKFFYIIHSRRDEPSEPWPFIPAVEGR